MVKNAKNIFFVMAAVVAMVLVGLSPMMPGVVAQGSGVQVSYLRARVNIDSSYTTTNIQVQFKNPSDAAVGETFKFQIPDDAFISNFSLTIKGKTYYARVMKAQDAQDAYANATAAGNNAGLVASRGRSTFEYSVNIAANENVTVGLRYEEYIARKPSGFSYSLPLSSYKDRPIGYMDVSIALNYDRPIEDLNATTYISQTSKVMGDQGKSATMSFKSTNITPSEDYDITWDLEPLPAQGKMLFYEKNGEGYFFHVFAPSAGDVGDYLPKDVVFVLDRSGSMDGTKLSQVKDAFSKVIRELRWNDRLGIVVFDDSIEVPYDPLLAANGQNENKAITKMNSYSSGGSTDINGALKKAIHLLDGSEGRVPIIVFLTDGLPTAGDTTDTVEIRKNVQDANKYGVRIFSLGFGSDVDFEFLRALSIENGGVAIKIFEDKDASDQIQGFYDTISLPLLTNIQFSYSNGTFDVLPTSVSVLFDGSEIVVCGKYLNGVSTVSFQASAITANGERTFSGEFPVSSSSNNAFIARYWAYAHIKDLTDRITVEKNKDSKKTLEDQAAQMSLDNSFVTPYTSLFVEIPKDALANPDGSTDTTYADGLKLPTPNRFTGGPKTKGAALTPGFELAFLAPALAIAAIVIARRKRREE